MADTIMIYGAGMVIGAVYAVALLHFLVGA